MIKYIPGIDISRWQGNIKWKVVRDKKIPFSYIRALNGLTLDPLLQSNITKAKLNGVPFGLYIWWRPEQDPILQAKLIMKLHKESGATMVPMIDVEDNQKNIRPIFMRRKLTRLVNECTRQLGKPPTIYTAAWFWNKTVNSTKFTHCPLWVARYVHYSSKAYKADPVPVAVSGWAKYAMARKQPAAVTGWGTNWSAWQFSAGYNACGKRYGMESSDLDLNIVKESEFNRFLCK